MLNFETKIATVTTLTECDAIESRINNILTMTAETKQELTTLVKARYQALLNLDAIGCYDELRARTPKTEMVLLPMYRTMQKEFDFDAIEGSEALGYMVDNKDDFEVGDYRFVKTDKLDNVLAEELTYDEYCLGCFNASFIASVMEWPIELVEAAQAGEAFEALGKAIISSGKMQELAEQYAAADGHAQHFNRYDGSSYTELGQYTAFQTN